jgi:2'-deoxynucleoside 5'-phosphate N-hydrolase
MLHESDTLIAEITAPSLGVGYEIAKAKDLGIPILTFYRNSPSRAPSVMIRGNDKIPMIIYKNKKEVFNVISEFIGNLP